MDDPKGVLATPSCGSTRFSGALSTGAFEALGAWLMPGPWVDGPVMAPTSTIKIWLLMPMLQMFVCVFTSEYEQVTIATQKNLSHLGMKCIKDGHGLPLAESIGSWALGRLNEHIFGKLWNSFILRNDCLDSGLNRFIPAGRAQLLHVDCLEGPHLNASQASHDPQDLEGLYVKLLRKSRGKVACHRFSRTETEPLRCLQPAAIWVWAHAQHSFSPRSSNMPVSFGASSGCTCCTCATHKSRLACDSSSPAGSIPLQKTEVPQQRVHSPTHGSWQRRGAGIRW